jgi:hypothetical protein
MCFSCNFWREILEKDAKRPPHTWCMVDGTHYVIEPDDPKATFQGFGGAEFHIYFKDGYEVVTHNLWCQGEPGEYWKDKFPNNADFDWKWQKMNEISYLVPKEEEEIPDELIAYAETNIGM